MRQTLLLAVLVGVVSGLIAQYIYETYVRNHAQKN